MAETLFSKQPTISVVIATYNRAQMVRQAVLAAWNQSLRPNEIVVSDDCSPDDTLSVLRELQKEVPILRVIESEKNSGGVPNWNQVIEASRGDIIAWCSDDDRFRKDHLETAVSYLIEHQDVDLVHAGFEEVFDEGGKVILHRQTPLKSDQPIVVTRHNAIDYFSKNFSWYFHPSTLVFRRKLWNRVGIFDAKYALADTDWFLRAAIDHTLVYLPYYGAINRRHPGGSGNWSGRVGSINMQRELYEAIHFFASAVRSSSVEVFDLDLQLSQWTKRYRMLLLRIFISRSRAGSLSVATDCATELSKITPLLLKIPRSLFSPLVYSCYLFLNGLQLALPGGRSKYRNLGEYIPM